MKQVFDIQVGVESVIDQLDSTSNQPCNFKHHLTADENFPICDISKQRRILLCAHPQNYPLSEPIIKLHDLGIIDTVQFSALRNILGVENFRLITADTLTSIISKRAYNLGNPEYSWENLFDDFRYSINCEPLPLYSIDQIREVAGKLQEEAGRTLVFIKEEITKAISSPIKDQKRKFTSIIESV